MASHKIRCSSCMERNGFSCTLQAIGSSMHAKWSGSACQRRKGRLGPARASIRTVSSQRWQGLCHERELAPTRCHYARIQDAPTLGHALLLYMPSPRSVFRISTLPRWQYAAVIVSSVSLTLFGFVFVESWWRDSRSQVVDIFKGTTV
jgi:hypothetical protein